MDFLGLPGAKPIMPPPPIVCPLDPKADPEPELPLAPNALVLPKELVELPLVLPNVSVELPFVPEESLELLCVPLGLLELPFAPEEPLELPFVPESSDPQPDPPVEELESEEPKLEPEEPKLEFDEPKLELGEPKLELEEPKLELEFMLEAVSPFELQPMMPIVEPASGTPKNPNAVGALFWPKWIGRQSSLPVMGSLYLLRRKRI